MTELQALADRLKKALDYRDIFGKDPTTTAAQVKAMYRKLARVAHPDRYSGEEERLAADVFTRLNALNAQAEQKLDEGKFGDATVDSIIRGRKAVHKVDCSLGSGDICSLWGATSSGSGGATFIKIAKNPRDGELLKTEAKALKLLHKEDNLLNRHFPALVDTFIYAPQADKTRRQANVIVRVEDCYDLREVKEAFDGLEMVHAAWVWRRLLMALGRTHDLGIVHGAVVPTHVLIHPKFHYVLLVDWCYASIKADAYPPIKAVVPMFRHDGLHKDWYPQEVLNKEAPSPATDLFQAARTLIYLMGADVIERDGSYYAIWRAKNYALSPGPMRAYFQGCLQVKQEMRPQSAWKLLKEFDELLKRLGPPFTTLSGQRTYIELVMPNSGTA
jgi:hypothetical protein